MSTRGLTATRRFVLPLAVLAALVLTIAPALAGQRLTVALAANETILVVDGVEVQFHAPAVPASGFSVTEPGNASQWAVAMDVDPFWEVSIIAAPFGTVPGVESLIIAERGGSQAYRDALASFRADQGALRVGAPVATLFGQQLHAALYEVDLAWRDEPSPTLLAEWVTEAGQRLWIVRWALESTSGEAPHDLLDGTISLSATEKELANETTVGPGGTAAPRENTNVATALPDLPWPSW